MKGYLFDLDGTLIQSMHVWENAVMRLFDRLNLKMDIDEARDAFSAMKFTEVLEALIQHFQLPMSGKELYGMVIDDVREQYTYTVQAVEGAVDYVKKCAAAGKRMCVVTANDVPLTEAVLRRLPHPERAVIHAGRFPATFEPCVELSFSLVSVDADLYAPTAAALPLFWERLSPGGALLVHDVNGFQYAGAGRAVREFCAERGVFPTPLCDMHGSVLLRKP